MKTPDNLNTAEQVIELATDYGIRYGRIRGLKKCDIPDQKINFYELDKCIPTIPTLQKLAKGLDYTVFDIID